ncbi:MAG TPA: SRPBCC family protein [Bacteroidia bacterium]|nr:SRPBCC family protein [Bacteroidia bacterium]
MKNLEAQISIEIDASPAKVWTAITSPPLIKKYLFGTEVKTDWKQGSPITYEGEYEGKTYEDKGIIVKFEPCKLFQSTYWSSMSGKPDRPVNYNLVTYELIANGKKTTVTVTQDNIASEEEKQHATKNWKKTLENLKKVVETE